MKHGGNLDVARQRYGEPPGGWIDLSTGINPVPYPFVPPAADAWTRLPQVDAEARLIDAARKRYGVSDSADIVAAPGTQLLIQLAARLRPGAKVAVVSPTYSEHAIAWALEGSRVIELAGIEALSAGNSSVPGFDVVVLVNPNNPDGRSWPPGDLIVASEALRARGGLFVVDEAFVDVRSEISLCPRVGGHRGVVVLRSFGKFYGLAGVRLGFAVGDGGEIERLRAWLGPWAVSGPAAVIGRQALSDAAWAEAARSRIEQDCDRLCGVLQEAGFGVVGRAGLFVLGAHAQAGEIAERLARGGILVRTFASQPTWLRFGLPAPDQFPRVVAAVRSAVV